MTECIFTLMTGIIHFQLQLNVNLTMKLSEMRNSGVSEKKNGKEKNKRSTERRVRPRNKIGKRGVGEENGVERNRERQVKEGTAKRLGERRMRGTGREREGYSENVQNKTKKK